MSKVSKTIDENGQITGGSQAGSSVTV